MADLGQPQNTIAVLQKYDFNFQKKFGQNFLIDPHVLQKIVHAAEIEKDDMVLEIGPGIGTVTQYLCEAAKRVVAVEIDRKLIGILEDTLSPYDNVEVINEDILKVDILSLVKEKNDGKKIKVVSNLPYYITTPIIMSLLEERIPVESMTFMMQEEVARRMQAEPGTKDYGALTLAVQYYAAPYIAAFVPKNCFIPRPNVGSAVIHLKCHEEPSVKVKDPVFMFKVIRASFAQRRKTLQNGLVNSNELTIGKEEAERAILSMQRTLEKKENALIRGEILALHEFALLSDYLLEECGTVTKD